ncbi:MAG: DUF2892 domain-containing protein [Syntrophomonadaceae bacterium]|nr:DUF2892 domain-containing protein [Syntrophomonadaceae bacterium]
MDKLKRNSSQGDRIMRTVLGAVFLLIGLSTRLTPGWSTLFLILAAYSFITAALAYDPFYALFNVSTNPKEVGENRQVE